MYCSQIQRYFGELCLLLKLSENYRIKALAKYLTASFNNDDIIKVIGNTQKVWMSLLLHIIVDYEHMH